MDVAFFWIRSCFSGRNNTHIVLWRSVFYITGPSCDPTEVGSSSFESPASSDAGCLIISLFINPCKVQSLRTIPDTFWYVPKLRLLY